MLVKVKSKPEKFRRCGIAFNQTAQEIDVDEKVLDILQNEPNLAVEVIKAAKTAAPAGNSAGVEDTTTKKPKDKK